MVLYWRIWAAVALVNLVVLSLFVALAAFQFGNINSALAGERLAVLAGRTMAPFAAAVKLGLPLSTVRNATALLERARQTDDAIVAIHVFDDAGAIVHSTAAPAPATIPLEAERARRAARGMPWYRETDDGFLGSIDIAAPDGSSAGGILIVYPGGATQTQARAMTAELLLAALVVLLGTSAFAAALLRFGLARQIRHFESVEAAYRAFEHGAWHNAAGAAEAPADVGASEWRQLLDAAEARYRETGRALTTARSADS